MPLVTYLGVCCAEKKRSLEKNTEGTSTVVLRKFLIGGESDLFMSCGHFTFSDTHFGVFFSTVCIATTSRCSFLSSILGEREMEYY